MLRDSFHRSLESDAYDSPIYSQPTFLDDDNYNFNYNYDGFSTHHEIGLNWTARIAGILSLLGGLYIGYWSWKRRDHVYHRIMFAVSVYIIIWSPWMIYGVAAIPIGTPGVIGAHGSVATCTAQGLFNHLSQAVPLYYVALSGFSWIVVVQGNFDPSKYAWAERYIHMAVNLWVIVSSSILLSLKAFNPSEGWPGCYIGSVPMGCGDDSGIPCERGPQNISTVLAVFVGLPVFVILIVPTITMVALACYLHWRSRRIEGNNITVRAVTKQSAVYLGTLYFIYTPGLIMSSMGTFFGEGRNLFMSYYGNAITVSMGFWFALVYRYFSAPSVSGGNGIVGSARRRVSKMLEPRKTIRGSCSQAFSIGNRSGQVSLPPGEQDGRVDNKITSRLRDEAPTESSCSEAPTTNDTKEQKQNELKQKSEEFRKSFSFNIFDGTAPSQSQWAEFIFEGDESDEENDKEETRYWAGCQDGV